MRSFDTSRFHPVPGGDLPWMFDDRSFSLLPDPGNDEELIALADEAPVLETPGYRTQTRVSNLKLSLSNRCPADCSYCFRDRKPGPPAPLGIGVQALEAMLQNHGREATIFVVSYNLTSEPLADLPALRELVQARRRLEARYAVPIRFFLCTSGLVQSPEALALVKEALDGDRLSVSIDGPARVHDAHRRDASGRGTYDRVLSLVRWAEREKVPLEAQAVLTKDFPYPDVVLDELLELGFASVNIKPVRPGYPGALGPDDVPVLLQSYDRYFARMDRAISRGDWEFFHMVKHDFPFKALWRYCLGTKVESRCFWGVNFLVMDHRGEYYPCDGVLGQPEFQVGTLADGIDWPRFHLDLSWRPRHPCSDCWARNLCGGTCPVAGITLANDPRAVDPVECALNAALTERCLGLVSRMLERGEDPLALAPILTDYYNQQTMTP
jgi:uncharacterized protein